MAIDELQVEDNVSENCVVYVRLIGTDNGQYIYRMYISNNPDEVFSEGWGEVPACNIKRELIDLDDDMYQYVVEFTSDIKLDLAQDCCCFSMQDSRDHIVALAYENLDDAEVYPEPRIIIQFGDTIESVEEQLAKRDVIVKYI